EPEEKDRLKITNGVKVIRVTNGILKEADVPVGFIISRVDKVNVYAPYDIYRVLDAKVGAVLLEGYLPNGDKKSFALEIEE
nr:deoxyribonuclease HsdR [Bacteroidota bacterium]